jgi:hypothetical protein
VRTRGHLHELGWTFAALGCGVVIAAATSCARDEIATANAAPAAPPIEVRAAAAPHTLPGPMEVYPYATDASVATSTPDAAVPAVDAVSLPPAVDAEPAPQPPKRDAAQPMRPRR